MSKRSKPGEGEICGIYSLGPADSYADGVGYLYNQTAIFASEGEDFAVSMFPVTVKAKAKVTQSELVQCLRDLADAIQQGLFVKIVADERITFMLKVLKQLGIKIDPSTLKAAIEKVERES